MIVKLRNCFAVKQMYFLLFSFHFRFPIHFRLEILMILFGFVCSRSNINCTKIDCSKIKSRIWKSCSSHVPWTLKQDIAHFGSFHIDVMQWHLIKWMYQFKWKKNFKEEKLFFWMKTKEGKYRFCVIRSENLVALSLNDKFGFNSGFSISLLT